MKALLAALLVFGVTIVFAQTGGDRADHAGNGSSGGGNIYGDQLNPWFLENTKNVSYCVEISPEFSELSRERILNAIEYAFNYWKKTFRDFSGMLPENEPYYTKLATQDFIYSHSCNSSIDIKFQMGTQTDEQKEQINFNQVIGLTQRTSYDRANLRGKGFIYIAPEKGLLRPQSSLIHSKPWSTNEGKFSLRVALIHEIGHIFGLQDDFYSPYGIMGATIVEKYVRKDIIDEFGHKDFTSAPSVFGCNINFDGGIHLKYSSNETSTIQNFHSNLRSFLGIETDTFDLNIETKLKKMEITLNDKKFGFINLNQPGSIPYSITPAISLYLTKEQNLFRDLSTDHYNNFLILYNIELSTNQKNLTLHLNDGREMKVFVNFDRTCTPTIGTIFNNEVYFDIFLGN